MGPNVTAFLGVSSILAKMQLHSYATYNKPETLKVEPETLRVILVFTQSNRLKFLKSITKSHLHPRQKEALQYW